MIRMKVRASVKKKSPLMTKIVRRKGRVYVINKKKPKHKQSKVNYGSNKRRNSTR